MRKTLIVSLCLLLPFFVKAQFNQEYYHIPLKKDSSLIYPLKLVKGRQYIFTVQQEGLDIKLLLQKDGRLLTDKDSPNGMQGEEKMSYTADSSGDYVLKVEPLADSYNAANGKVSVSIRQLTKKDLERMAAIKKELAPENKKNVLTLDVDHFWEAFDSLQLCKTKQDSIRVIQTLYLDRGTDGLADFTVARSFIAERFVNAIARVPKFYASIRANSYKAKEAAPAIEEVFSQFKKIYPHFQPFKVCFAIGLVNTGGTVSSKFVLIGTEVTTSTKFADLSEFNNSAYAKMLQGDENFLQRIKDMVAHEAVHTQQNFIKSDSNAIICPLLYSCIREGGADFIGQLTSNGLNNAVIHEYGNAHEKELWKQFKNELCNTSSGNWLYNYGDVKDKPADLGYYIGYRIARAYYNNAKDKGQAVSDIIEMSDPVKFLDKSHYDQETR